MTDSSEHVYGVVVGCRADDDRWLLIRRSTTVRSPLAVCFPGGHIEFGEQAHEAVVREMREELGLEVTPLQHVWSHTLMERPVTLFGWLAELGNAAVVPSPDEVHEVLWLTAEQASNHPDGMPHTREFVAALLEAVRNC
ncbi:MAG: NUDIX hydrolase [bacterium]|nr:NUDIX hydrolase [bacterium]MCP5066027.1 NUDIX hydrolase [bacterium]